MNSSCMRFIVGSLLFLFTLNANAESSRASKVRVQDLSFEEYRMHRDFEETAKKDKWTFTFDVTQVAKYSTGYVAKKTYETTATTYESLGAGKTLKSIDLKDFGRELNPVMDQGQCGSCVVFSFMANIMDLFLIRDESIPLLSAQYLMSCGRGGQCNGADGETVGKDTVRLGNFYTESNYPYRMRSMSCQSGTGTKYGPIIKYKTLDGSDRSILAALSEGRGVSVGIAANNTLMSYTGGVYNACNSSMVNHYVYIQGLNCGTSVDSAGNCVFDSSGNLKRNSGAWVNIRNSWGTSYGESGNIRMVIWDRYGRRCHGLAGPGDAQVLYNGLPLPE